MSRWASAASLTALSSLLGCAGAAPQPDAPAASPSVAVAELTPEQQRCHEVMQLPRQVAEYGSDDLAIAAGITFDEQFEDCSARLTPADADPFLADTFRVVLELNRLRMRRLVAEAYFAGRDMPAVCRTIERTLHDADTLPSRARALRDAGVGRPDPQERGIAQQVLDDANAAVPFFVFAQQMYCTGADGADEGAEGSGDAI
jgi:hypothetical protein